MSLNYLHQKLSLAVFEMCTSTQGLKERLRNSLRHSFTAFPEETLPEEMCERFSEIRRGLTQGVARFGFGLENYPDVIDRMSPSEVRRFLNSIIALHQCVTEEYYRRRFRQQKEVT